ncbi:TRAP transporter substrate-binding protein [Pararhodospirillum oryzae]|uniref:C4-dicarboxylate ABC transporter substrate-binding protein n=1 Tax=Pararhodospirillum oryzae TaxID=478448 RepID=A0A512HB10_9PROT|nr:TRAP transporter substrate-binding protein [Pararhodospirillum oryzae]GEO82647.1 C4-dicarboxylate ABC transporter substrate-binding protein [Pararhodospirillum oryzae]
MHRLPTALFRSFALSRLTAVFLMALGLFGGAGGPAARAADVTLRFAHFWPSVSGPHRLVYQEWAKAVEAASGGRLKVDLYPGATLVKAPAQYDAVRSRIADVTATIQGYTANRFPLSQIVELPGLVTNGVQGSCILQNLYDEGLIADEYKDTRPLFFFTHGPGQLHLRDRAVTRPEDLAGLRIRRPTVVVGALLESLGAQPVALPAPDTYPAMERGVIDGAALPWEAMESFRLNELTRFHAEVGGLYTLAFVVTMNKDVYNGLPDDLKAVIDAQSGAAWARRAGGVFDDLDTVGRKAAEAAGHAIVTIEGGADNPAWKPALDAVTEAHLAELESRGLPARAVYARARALADTCNARP